MKKRIEEEDVKAFKAKFNIGDKTYNVNFFDFPAEIQMRIAFKGMASLLSTSRNPEAALKGMKQGYMPGDKTSFRYPLYVTALARILNITEEEAKEKADAMRKEDRKKLNDNPAIKKQMYLLKAERIDGNQDNEV